MSAHEKIAYKMKQRQIECEGLPLSLHSIEGKQYYSQIFSLPPKLTTKKGYVKIMDKNIDFVQFLPTN